MAALSKFSAQGVRHHISKWRRLQSFVTLPTRSQADFDLS